MRVETGGQQGSPGQRSRRTGLAAGGAWEPLCQTGGAWEPQREERERVDRKPRILPGRCGRSTLLRVAAGDLGEPGNWEPWLRLWLPTPRGAGQARQTFLVGVSRMEGFRNSSLQQVRRAGGVGWAGWCWPHPGAAALGGTPTGWRRKTGIRIAPPEAPPRGP